MTSPLLSEVTFIQSSASLAFLRQAALGSTSNRSETRRNAGPRALLHMHMHMHIDIDML